MDAHFAKPAPQQRGILLDDGPVEKTRAEGKGLTTGKPAVTVARVPANHLFVSAHQEVGRGDDVGRDDQAVPLAPDVP